MADDKEVKEFQAFIVQEAKSKGKDPNQYAKELGEEGMKEAYKRFQASRKKKAAHGAKLNYFRSLNRQCPEGEELFYFKKGGSVGCGCKKKEDGGEVSKAESGWKSKFKTHMENGIKKVSDAGREIMRTESQSFSKPTPKKKKVMFQGKEQLIVGKDIQRGNGGPDAKVQDSAVPNEDIPSHDKKTKKNCGGSKMKFIKKGAKVCPKCGKVHSANEGCAVAKFKARRLGGIL